MPAPVPPPACRRSSAPTHRDFADPLVPRTVRICWEAELITGGVLGGELGRGEGSQVVRVVARSARSRSMPASSVVSRVICSRSRSALCAAVVSPSVIRPLPGCHGTSRPCTAAFPEAGLLWQHSRCAAVPPSPRKDLERDLRLFRIS